jgi:hypothetical protein
VCQASTHDAALFEAAYFMDNALFPNEEEGGARNWTGIPGLEQSMLATRPTAVLVYPACPNAFMHPSIAYEQSSGAGNSRYGGIDTRLCERTHRQAQRHN